MSPRFRLRSVGRATLGALVVTLAVLVSAGCGDTAAEKAAINLVDHGSGVLFGKLPKLKTTAEIQEDTLKSDVKGAACDWLYSYVSTGQESPSVFYGSLARRLVTYGSPAQNEFHSISGEFEKLRNTVNGKTDASDAAKRLACSYLPG
jgi:hypothetical protein